MARSGEPGWLIDGRYRLEATLGAGGFGEVWRAIHVVDGEEVRPVAVKLLDPPDAAAAAEGHDWLDEVRAVRDVVCDAVPTIFDAGVDRDGRTAFIAMELLAGETLDDRLERGPIRWRRALAIARSVARALAACHRVGVVHCDLKPQNVFLCASGRVCVLDFGVAALGERRQRPRSEPSRHATHDPLATDAVSEDMMPTPATSAPRMVRVVGTAGYLAPEAYAGEGRTAEGDAYALGILLYRMIAGRLPQRLPDELATATGDSSAIALRWRTALATATVRGELIPLAEAAPDTPAALAALIDRLLAMRPGDRPSTSLEDALAEVALRPHGVPEPPYVGLEAFDARRAGYLAGRDADTAQIVERLGARRAVFLAGPSGSGKSSLAIAGVAARIDAVLLDDTDGWELVVVRPGEPEALRITAAAPATPPAPAPTAPRDSSSVNVTAPGSNARRGGKRGTGAPPAGTPPRLGTVVVVDQLEEVLRLGDADREQVCAALAALVAGDATVAVGAHILGADQPVRVVATARDDLFGRLAAIPALRRFPEQNLYVVRGVEPNAVPDIVVGPARAAGFRLDGEAAVVAEASALLDDDPGALPLVQFALTRWWDRRDRDARSLPRAAWTEIGGIAGALADAAGELHGELDVEQRAAMRRILVALFRPDGTRVRQAEAEVAPDELSRVVVELLVTRRLVRRDAASSTLEVVHEALGARWPLLRGWLDETRAERELVHDLRVDAERWKRSGQPVDLLWRGARLAAILPLRDRLGDHDGFVAAALEVEGGQRRRRRAALAIGAGLVAVAIILVVAWAGSNAARQRAELAQQAADHARADAEAEAAQNRALRAEAEAKVEAAEGLRVEAERAAAALRADAEAQLRAAEGARADAEAQLVVAEEQRRRAAVAAVQRDLAEEAAAAAAIPAEPIEP